VCCAALSSWSEVKVFHKSNSVRTVDIHAHIYRYTYIDTYTHRVRHIHAHRQSVHRLQLPHSAKERHRHRNGHHNDDESLWALRLLSVFLVSGFVKVQLDLEFARSLLFGCVLSKYFMCLRLLKSWCNLYTYMLCVFFFLCVLFVSLD